MKIEWNEDKTKATISKEDFESLQAKAEGVAEKLTEKYNEGFGKGVSKGEKNILKKLDFLELEEEDVDKSLSGMKTIMLDLKAGKIPKEIMDKLKDSDIVKDLQGKLEKTNNQLKSKSDELDNFKRSTLIGDRIKNLATAPPKELNLSKAFNPQVVSTLFQNEFDINIDEKNNISIKHKTGNPIFDNDGKEMPFEKVYSQFYNANKYLFEANGSGGSGGGDGSGGSGPATDWGKMSLKEKTEYSQKYGKEAAKKLIDAQFAQK